MIQEVPFAIYIDSDISLNSLPSSVEIVQHEAVIIMEAVNRSYYRSIIKQFAYVCNKCVLLIFMITFMIAIICVLFPLNRIKK